MAATKQELERLLDLVKGKRKILIVCHENPDPDTIAAAFGLRYIFRKARGVSSIITYSGIIGRAENQSMVRLLGIDMVPFSDISPKNYSVIALVDCQPYTGNVSLPKSARPSIVIDHHPLRKSTLRADYIDVRKDVGSTSTIITQYIRNLNLDVDRKVATALFYGIKSDTRDLGRQTTDADIRTSVFLFPFIMQKKLSKIEHPQLPKEYFVELFSVLNNVKIYRDVVVAKVEMLTWPEIIGEIADELIQMEGIKWCFCYGKHNGSILYSIRTVKSRYMAGVLAHKISQGIGTGGGHETFAGGKVDLNNVSKKVKDPEDLILKRFLKEMNCKDMQPKTLIKPGTAFEE